MALTAMTLSGVYFTQPRGSTGLTLMMPRSSSPQAEGFSAAPTASTQLMGGFCQAESTHRPRGTKERGKQAL